MGAVGVTKRFSYIFNTPGGMYLFLYYLKYLFTWNYSVISKLMMTFTKSNKVVIIKSLIIIIIQFRSMMYAQIGIIKDAYCVISVTYTNLTKVVIALLNLISLFLPILSVLLFFLTGFIPQSYLVSCTLIQYLHDFNILPPAAFWLK